MNLISLKIPHWSFNTEDRTYLLRGLTKNSTDIMDSSVLNYLNDLFNICFIIESF
jgi:hypothetical protein